MRPRGRSALLLSLLVLMTGCDVQPVSSSRSGTIKEDYVEEPLTDRTKKYANALRVSNDVLENFRRGEYHTVYQGTFDPRLKATLDEPKFVAMMKGVESQLGPIRQYKPMQWGFQSKKNGSLQILISTKIVEHEKGMMRYFFVFPDDGRYEKLVGIHWNARTGVRPPGHR